MPKGVYPHKKRGRKTVCGKCDSTDIDKTSRCRPCRREKDRKKSSAKTCRGCERSDNLLPNRCWCRECWNNSQRKYYHDNKHNSDLEICRTCGEDKPVQSYCRKCREESVKQYRLRNPEKVCISSRTYYKNNTLKCRERSLKCYYDNKESRSLYHKKWCKENRDKRRASQQKRRSAKASSEGYWTEEEWTSVVQAQGGKCNGCGEIRKLTADHIQPLSKGGSNWIANIQGLCKPCNSAKRDKTPEEWAEFLMRKKNG